MDRANFSEDFKRDAVVQITNRGYPVAEVSKRLVVSQHSLYAWKKQFSPSTRGDDNDAEIRQTELVRQAWEESGKGYGYRKLHDDLLDQGEVIYPNRVARLARKAGIKAQIGYKRRPDNYGGKPSVVVDNTLDRQFD